LKARFLTEAEAAALTHPNICVVHEIDEADGDSFTAMEYIEGGTLAEKIKKRPLPSKTP
jgi:eukaryotic-like serine/threonine-protein kinase